MENFLNLDSDGDISNCDNKGQDDKQRQESTESEENIGFIFEKEPSESQDLSESNNTASTDITNEVPSYDTEFNGYLASKVYSMETGKEILNDARPKKKCFNCLGDHSINNCMEKRDSKQIARNRQAMLNQRRLKNTNVRYHEETENKYGNFKPGDISDSLRLALGLRYNEAPEFIYRMRVLGYPPGWLKDAEVRRSDVTLIDGTGNVLSHPDDEDGETDVPVIRYDPEKLISFPGFNVPFEDHIRDDHEYYNYPEIQWHHHRKNFEKFMKRNKVTKYKKKKLKLTDTPQPSLEIRTTRDMDIEDLEGVVATPADAAPLQINSELPKLQELKKDREEGEVSEDSNESDSLSKPKTPDESVSTSSDTLGSTLGSSQISQISVTTEGESPLVDTPVSSRTKRHHHRSKSTNLMMGVCIPECISPFSSTPKSENWAVDISDHILFENLPDTLGTWNKMKGIVKSVKLNMEILHASDEEC